MIFGKFSLVVVYIFLDVVLAETSIAMGSKLLLSVKIIFDLVAFGLAVAAEQRRSTAKITQDDEKDYNYCVYNSDISTSYGVGAFLILMASQVLVMVASRCFCCGKALSPRRARAWAVIFFLTCWMTFVIAEACLLAGSVRNAYHTKYRTMFNENPPSCEMLRKGVFGAGAAFIVFTSILSGFYYSSYSKAKGIFLHNGKETSVSMGTFITS